MPNKVYEIIFRDKKTETRKTTATPMTGEERSTAKSEMQDGGITLKQGIAAYHYAKKAINTVASYQVSTIQLRTGNARAQQKAEFAYQIVQDASNVLESTIVGAVTGGLPGALVGTAVGAAAKVVGYAQNGQRINTEFAVENVTIAQNSLRISAGGNRKGAV